MTNTRGDAYGLTVLFPVKHGHSENATHLEGLRRLLADLPDGAASPFAREPLTHFSRFVVVERLAFNGEPYPADTLPTPFLLWTACFNGPLDVWLHRLWGSMEDELRQILAHCEAFDAADGPRAFAAYVERFQVTTSFLFADYPEASVKDVLEGLKLKKHFVQFLCANQGAPPATLKANFSEWWQQMAATAPPTPGTTY